MPPPRASREVRTSGARGASGHRLSIAIALGIAAVLLTPLPALPLPESWPFPADWMFSIPLDKLVHFALFGAASHPWYRSLRALGASRFMGPGQAAVATILFAIAYGLLLELAQGAFPASRAAELADVAADGLGALAGVLLVLRRQRSMPPVNG